MWKRFLAVGLALFASGCNWPIDVRAVLSDGEVYTGTVMGGTNRGSMNLTNGKGTDCIGEYASGLGFLNCSDGDRAQIQYATLRLGVGYGFGTTASGRGMRFTFGMSEAEAATYLRSSTAAAGGGPARPPSAKRGSGTGFYITRQGHVLTNAHVVERCASLTVQQPGTSATTAILVAADSENDVAILRSSAPAPAIALLRGSRAVRPGEPVVAFGFPLSGTVSSGGILTTGTVSALAGLRDDTRYLQIAVPIQPGNSGGPLMDMNGAVIGITSASLDDRAAVRRTGAVPQQVNFAVKTEVVRTFLSTNGVSAESSGGGRELSAADVGERARAFTVRIECKG